VCRKRRLQVSCQACRTGSEPLARIVQGPFVSVVVVFPDCIPQFTGVADSSPALGSFNIPHLVLVVPEELPTLYVDRGEADVDCHLLLDFVVVHRDLVAGDC